MTILLLATIFSGVTCLICVGLCLKIYTEIMKEHTIRRRYENQKKEGER